jgi:uncharacterized membrane protein YedE/YeeE
MGLGMAIAAGCPFRLITRASEGELLAVTALAGFVVGIIIFAYALPTLHHFFAPFVYYGAHTFPQLFSQIFK